MPTDLALNSEGTPGADEIAAALAAIPNDVAEPLPSLPDGGAVTPPTALLPTMEPWAAVNVDWVVPLAGKLLQLPYEQAAKVTGDDCWLVTDDQIALINPAMENAIKWVVWRLGAANTISHPLVGFGVALGSLTAVKYGVYQFNQHQRDQGAPEGQRNPSHRSQNRPQRPGNPQPTNTDSSMVSGRMGESGEESYSAGNPTVAKATLPRKEFIVVEE